MILAKRFRCIFFIAINLVSNSIFSDMSYLGVASFITQAPISGKGSKIKFEDLNISKGIEISDDKTEFVIQDAGVYHVILVVNVGATIAGATGYVDCWLQKNDKHIPGTNTRASIDIPSAMPISTINYIEKFEKNDSLSIVFTGSGPGVGIVATKPIVEPYVSAATLVILKVE